MRLGGSPAGLVGSTAVGSGGLNPLKTPGGGSPSAKGYPTIKNEKKYCHTHNLLKHLITEEVAAGNFMENYYSSFFNVKTLPRAPRAGAFGGRIFAAPGEPEAVLASSFFPEEEAGVDLADEGLKGSFLLPSPFSLGDLLPLLLADVPLLPLEESSSSTTKSASLRSPSLISFCSFFIFLASGDLDRRCGSEVAGDMDVLLFCKA